MIKSLVLYTHIDRESIIKLHLYFYNLSYLCDKAGNYLRSR
jgi:hypothetical protein